jgi:hypothetical protein
MKKIISNTILITSFLLLKMGKVYTQDIGNMFKTNPLKINGGIAANTLTNFSSAAGGNRQPFTYTLSGTLNIAFLEWSMPVNFVYSNAGASTGYQVPSIYALHPSYKWVKAHVGYGLSMSFSPYTLSGQMFNGAGIELSPKGILKVQAMYGEFFKPNEWDSARNVLPKYKRVGAATKIEMKQEQFSIAYNFLYSEDRASSLARNYEMLQILPQKNLAMGIQFSTQWIKNVSFDGEIGGSLLTQDKAAKGENKYGFIGNWINANNSTAFYKAIKLNTTFNAKVFTLGVGYERIDPNYMAHGALNYNNDFQNITGNFSVPMFKNKIVIGGSIGYQNDNIESQKSNETGRLVSSFNAKVTASKKLNFNFTYSNFNSITQVKAYQNSLAGVLPPNPDSLKFLVTNRNLNFGANYMISSNEKKSQNINFQMSYAENASQRGEIQTPKTLNINNNIGYSLSYVKSKATLNVGCNLNLTKMDTNQTLNMAPLVSYSQPLKINKEDLKMNLSLMYNNAIQNGNSGVKTFSFRGSASYVLKKKHNLSFMMGGTFNSAVDNNPSVVMFTSGLNYSYSFSLLEPKKK